jgi:hypothetical protein
MCDGRYVFHNVHSNSFQTTVGCGVIKEVDWGDKRRLGEKEKEGNEKFNKKISLSRKKEKITLHTFITLKEMTTPEFFSCWV